MSPLSKLRDFFPQYNSTTLNVALEAASGNVGRAIDYLLNDPETAAVSSDSINLRSKTSPISAERIEVAEKRLSNPAFRQPLTFNTTTDSKIKEEVSTSLNMKSEPLDSEQLNTLSALSTQTEVNDPHSGIGPSIPNMVNETAHQAQEASNPNDNENVSATYPLVETPLETLKTLFPGVDQDECERALQRCDNNIERAFELLEVQHSKELLSSSSLQGGSTTVGENNLFKQPNQISQAVEDSVIREEELRMARAQKKRAVPELDFPVSCSLPKPNTSLAKLIQPGLFSIDEKAKTKRASS
jgi:hypothetical protein